jgi:hypothetical protein
MESEMEDVDEAPFRLVCKNCGKNFELRNPAKWYQEHKACTVGRGVRYSMRRASTSTTAPEDVDVELLVPKRAQTELQCFMMTPAQIFQWCTLLVKGMVTSCIPFTFVMNTYIQLALAMLAMLPTSEETTVLGLVSTILAVWSLTGLELAFPYPRCTLRYICALLKCCD